MNKKFLIILAAIFLVLVFGIIYWATTSKPTKIKAGIKTIFSKEVAFPHFTEDQKLVFFNPEKAQFFQIENYEKVNQLKNRVFFTDQIIWSPRGQKMIVQTSNIEPAKQDNPFFAADRPMESNNFWFYELDTEQKTLLDQRITQIIWFPDGQKIVYIFNDDQTGQNRLSVSQPDGQEWQNITSLNSNDVLVEALDNQNIVMATKNDSVKKFWVYNLETKKKTDYKFTAEEILFSPNKKFVLLQMPSGEAGKSKLTFYNLDNSTEQDLGFASTTSRAAWSPDSKFLFVAIPAQFSAVPNQSWDECLSCVNKEQVSGTDELWQYNVEKKTKKQYLTQTDAFNKIFNLMISPDAKYLFFASEATISFYRLKIEAK